ncbi:MAG: glycoside-pentoside-hexuronide (GPH):cation symporter [Propionibacteriaceae bacterium]|jgi:melibiose permease/lactose/raffinose/galactose permease|nr:glycoside-pentoside-hexuronide (GPH):cation symporter [Propionibacteriaceae bacterium]
MTSNLHRRNKWTFSVGTVGRDMVYTLISTYFLATYVVSVLQPSDAVLAWVSGLILAARLFDVVMDLVMGSIVDNTRSRWGQFKPWILAGVFASALFTVLLFSPFEFNAVAFVTIFFLLYLCWSLTWTMNDIPYWSLLPALTLVPKEREDIGSLAKIFAYIGLFAVAGSIIPVTTLLGHSMSAQMAWLVYTLCVVAVMLAGQMVTLFGTKVPTLVVPQERVRLREIYSVIVKNDQLLWVAIAMILFMTGYLTTTTLGVPYFQFIYGDKNMYTPFTIVLAVASIGGLLVFPTLRKRFSRRTLYTAATVLIVGGYVVFFLAPTGNFIVIAVGGLLLFLGDTLVSILMLMFISDTIDYGHWKLGRRNTAITFALQPFINKLGAALSAEVAALALIWSGINAAKNDPDLVTAGGQTVMKLVMLVFPLVTTVIAFVLWRWKYRIDETFYARILADLRERGQLIDEESVTTE